MSHLSSSAPAVLQSYYQILTGGAEAYGQGEELRRLLAEQLEFSGALAGHHTDATNGFLHGVAGFIATVRSIDVLSEVHDDDSSAVLYDAVMPGGTVRFAEFFAYRDNVIDRLFLHYDGPDYIDKGGR
jgi:hypothetical protein